MKTVMKPVDMIAYFTIDELPRPMRFRVKAENGEYLAFNIERVLTRTEEKAGRELSLIYKCECTINHRKRVVEFKYESASCRWTLTKL